MVIYLLTYESCCSGEQQLSAYCTHFYTLNIHSSCDEVTTILISTSTVANTTASVTTPTTNAITNITTTTITAVTNITTTAGAYTTNATTSTTMSVSKVVC